MVRLKDLKIEYDLGSLSLDEMGPDPFQQTASWLQEAINQKILHENAVALSTATKNGTPSCRMVLIKEWSKKGALFFTDYRSRKSQELIKNPQACITFWWKELERQLIIEGTVTKASRRESENYFTSRPHLSQVAASISHQGSLLESRKVLEQKANALKKTKNLPLPSHWGGFWIKPTQFQFWQGRPNRLHDRFIYTKKGRKWTIDRLYP